MCFSRFGLVADRKADSTRLTLAIKMGKGELRGIKPELPKTHKKTLTRNTNSMDIM